MATASAPCSAGATSAIGLRPAELDREWIVNRARCCTWMATIQPLPLRLRAGRARQAFRSSPISTTLYPGVEELIANIDYLIVSRDFSCRLMNETNLESALRRMQSRYGCRLTAATLGQDGVLAWDGKQLLHSAAYRVPVVDTTGAGDIFHAGFIYGLLHDWPLDRQLDFSCAAAAMNCMAHGARGGIQPVDAIENTDGHGATRYESAYDVERSLTEQRMRFETSPGSRPSN